MTRLNGKEKLIPEEARVREACPASGQPGHINSILGGSHVVGTLGHALAQSHVGIGNRVIEFIYSSPRIIFHRGELYESRICHTLLALIDMSLAPNKVLPPAKGILGLTCSPL